MAHLSEAACLLNAGARYRSRVLLEPSEGEPIFAGFKSGAFSIYFGDAPIFHFDLEGRWQRAFIEGTHYLKSLDTSVQAIERVREGVNLILRRRRLRYGEVSDLDATIRDAAADLLAAIETGRLRRIEPPANATAMTASDLVATLDLISRWDASAWFSQRERYRSIYGPLAFLPPDALSSVILQCTVGTRDGFTFGGAPSGPLLVRSPNEFEAHAKAAARFLGRRTEQGKSLLLGGSDFLLEAGGPIHEYLRLAVKSFPVDSDGGLSTREVSSTLQGIHFFLDRFGQELPTLEDWRAWKDLGLTGVSLGIESGDPDIRALHGKSLGNRDLIRLVQTLGEAGLRVGLVVLLADWGECRRDSHLESTASLISSLDLRPGEIVSFVESKALRREGPDQQSIGGVAAVHSQFEALKASLQPWRSARGTKVVFHNLEKQGVL